MSNDIETQLKKFVQSEQDRVLDFSRSSHARLGKGHTGGHVKLKDWLAFQAGFAQAKDAVFSNYATNTLRHLCHQLALACIEIYSEVNDPILFLLRPDLGKQLAIESKTKLNQFIHEHAETCYKNLLIVISGGLSPNAIAQQIPGFLPIFINKIRQQHWSMAPIIINPKGRVALGDQLNIFFKADIVIMLIGERPGLSTPDSMGIYFTYHAKPGNTDEQRNCISNIHQHGLSHDKAATKLIDLLNQSMISKISGVTMKDDVMQYKSLI